MIIIPLDGLLDKFIRGLLRGKFFYVRRVVNLMETTKVNAYIMYIFGKIELLSHFIHAT